MSYGDVRVVNPGISAGIPGETVRITIGSTYQGGPLSRMDREEQLVRKAIGLPVTKQLVYYPNKRNKGTVVKVTAYQVIEIYDLTDRWYTVELILEDGNRVRIHSDYLAEMQRGIC